MSLRADMLEHADVLEFAGQVLGPCELEPALEDAFHAALQRLLPAGP
jgi:hypothetical protein